MNKTTFLDSCIFCQIIKGKAEAKTIWENEDFLAIENKFPEAPIHILVIPKWHIEKFETRATQEDFWMHMMKAVWAVVVQEGFDKTGYKLENNGAGYNHLEHEHVHIMSGMPK